MAWEGFWVSFGGGLARGLLVGCYFHFWATSDLKQEAAGLRKLSILFLRAMEEAKLVKFARGESGEPKGLVFEEEFRVSVSAQAKAEGQVR